MGRTLITGGAGFIGSHLVHALVARGDPVRVLDDLSSGSADRLPSPADGCELTVGSVTDAPLVAGCMPGVEQVIHLAAQVSVTWSMDHPDETYRINDGGTGVVLEAAAEAGVRRVVLASSCAVYGDPRRQPVDEGTPTAPGSPYAGSKLAAEGRVLAALGDGGPEGVVLRYFNVYGPRQDPGSPYAAVIPLFARALLRRRPLTIYGDGRQTRDFCFVGDVVRANLRACEAPEAPGQVFNIGTGEPSSVRELVERLAQQVGQPAEVIEAPAREGEVRHSRADVSRARRVLGFAASVGLEEGLERTVAWMREREESR